MKMILKRFIFLLFLSFFLHTPSIHANQSDKILLFVTSEYCIYCKAWERDVGTVYQKSAYNKHAPLRRLDISSPQYQQIAFKKPIRLTPTFIILKDSAEIGRIEGYHDADQFFWQLSEYIKFD